MKPSSQQVDQETVQTLKWFSIFIWLFLIIDLIFLALLSWRGILPAVDWNIVNRSWNRYEISTTTIDSQGDPWFIAQKEWPDDSYELRHITGKQVDAWELPSLTLKEVLFAAVTKDTKGDPWLILGDKLAHWDGAQWTDIPMPLRANLKSFVCPSVVSRGATVWGIDDATEHHTRLIRLDLDQDPIQAQEIGLPEGLSLQDYGFYCLIPTNGNGILAVLTNGTRQDFYQLKNLEWQSITSFQGEQDMLGISDITSDSRGHIWVLLGRWAPGVHVGKYDLQENTWTWYDIEVQSEIANRFLDYGHIAVDDLGRIWLSAVQYKPLSATDTIGSHNYETYAVGVFEQTPNHKLMEIRHYTTLNSSLETSPLAKIIIGPDKKLWTWNKQLVWMDSSQQELSQPLRRSSVTFVNRDVLTGLLVLAFVPLFIVAIVLQIHQRKRNS